jgi:hypothetical protein
VNPHERHPNVPNDLQLPQRSNLSSKNNIQQNNQISAHSLIETVIHKILPFAPEGCRGGTCPKSTPASPYIAQADLPAVTLLNTSSHITHLNSWQLIKEEWYDGNVQSGKKRRMKDQTEECANIWIGGLHGLHFLKT